MNESRNGRLSSRGLFCFFIQSRSASANTNQQHHQKPHSSPSSECRMRGWVSYSPTTGQYAQIRCAAVNPIDWQAEVPAWKPRRFPMWRLGMVSIAIARLALRYPILERHLASVRNQARGAALRDRAALLAGRELQPYAACQVYRGLKSYKDEFAIIQDIFLQNAKSAATGSEKKDHE